MDEQQPEDVRRHDRVAVAAIVAGVVALAAFRALLELGFAPTGSRQQGRIPVEYVLAAWFTALAALVADRRHLSGIAKVRATAFDWWLSVIGVTQLLIYADVWRRARLLTSTSWVYWFSGACMLTVFISSACIDRRGAGLLSSVARDLIRVLGRPTTWACAIVALGVLGFAPRSGEIPPPGPAFTRWYLRQKRTDVPVGWRVAPVTLVELIDYQSPICRQVAARYAQLLGVAKKRYGDAFRFVRIDFPLEYECNSFGGATTGGPHPAACESAAAVRFASRQRPSREEDVIQWLWDNQSQLSREYIFDGLKSEFGLNLQPDYDQLAAEIGRETASGRALGVHVTPTFFLNGRRLPIVTSDVLEAAIALEVAAAARQ